MVFGVPIFKHTMGTPSMGIAGGGGEDISNGGGGGGGGDLSNGSIHADYSLGVSVTLFEIKYDLTPDFFK